MTSVKFALMDRLNVNPNPNVRLEFEESTQLAHFKSKSLVNAIVHSIETGTPFSLYVGREKLVLTAGMIDLRNEPWGKKSPLFFVYQIKGGNLCSIDDIVATHVGEIVGNGRSVILRQTKGILIPASTAWVRTHQTAWEMYSGFMDGIVNKEGPAFDIFSQSMLLGQTTKIKTSVLRGGLGYARFSYHPSYLVTQLERVYPWQRSEAIWPREGDNIDREAARHLYHGGFSFGYINKIGDPPWLVAYRAAGYFFSAKSTGGSFHRDGKIEHDFGEDITAGGLIPPDQK